MIIVSGWEDIKCTQYGYLYEGEVSVRGQEDCLYLNVHVPGVWPPHDPLPVMIWFTGGAFVFGSGPMYGPDYWMTENIILVTVNYRVGPFGFLRESFQRKMKKRQWTSQFSNEDFLHKIIILDQ